MKKKPAPTKRPKKSAPPKKKAPTAQKKPAGKRPKKPASGSPEEKPAEDFAKAPIEIWMPPPRGANADDHDPGGRPRHDIDLDVVEQMAAIGATIDEIAAACRVHPRTLYRRQHPETRDEEFCEALERGQASGRFSLRRWLWVSAQRGVIAAQIFLAKQPALLGFVDKVEHTGPGGDGPIHHTVTIEFVDPPPRPEEPKVEAIA